MPRSAHRGRRDGRLDLDGRANRGMQLRRSARSLRWRPEPGAAAAGVGRRRRVRETGQVAVLVLEEAASAVSEVAAAAAGAEGSGGRSREPAAAARSWTEYHGMARTCVLDMRSKSFFHFAVARLRNYLLLRAGLIRGSAKEVLRKLYSRIGPLRRSGSADLSCSALLRVGAPRIWKPEGFRTRPYLHIAAMFKIGNSKELPPIPDHLSEQCKDFIRKCLQRDPSQRPSAMELLQHPLIKNRATLERSVTSDPLEHLAVISCRPNSKVVGHTRDISSLGFEGQTIYQRRGAKFSSKHSNLHIRSNISCPVSPCGSPLLRSRSPQNTNGRMSPSPISSPRTLSGASTPLSGGNGAIPFNHLKQPTYSNEGFAIASRGPDDHFPNRPTDRNLGQFARVHQVSQGLQERAVSDADILSPQYGKRLGNVFDLRDRLSPSEHFTCHAFVDHVKPNPPLDFASGSPHLGLRRDN